MNSRLGVNEQETSSALGRRIRHLRHVRGWTQADFAIAACINVSHVSRIERGVDHPSLSTLAWISVAFGLSDAGELLSGIDPKEFMR